MEGREPVYYEDFKHKKPLHGSDEPVTDITAYDMAVWCNALSELMGRKPVYFVDRGFKTVHKSVVKFRPIQFHFPEDYIAKYGQPKKADTPSFGMGAGASESLPGVYVADAMERVLPPLYANAQADGFRLPSVAEYQQAVVPDGRKYPWGNDAKGVFEHAWLFDSAGGTTHPVGQKKPTALGLYDVLGNVSELSSPGLQTRMRTVRLGGSILDLTVGFNRGLLASDAPPPTWPYCDTGFRVVRQLPGQVSLRSEAADSDAVSHVEADKRQVQRRQPKKPSGETVLEIDPAKFDPLQDRVHRGNLRRDGVFQANGVTKVKGVKWRFQTEGPIKSSPVAVDGIVYVGSNDEHIYAVDAEKGTEVWKVKTRGAVAGSAAVVGGVVYIASEDGRMFALDAKSGEKKWITPFSRRRPCGSPAVAYGVVFIGEGARGGHEMGAMSAGPVVGLDAKTGEVMWRGPSGPQGYAAICLDESRLYAGTNGSNFGTLDLATGKSLWSHTGGHQNRQFMSFTRAGELAYVPGSMTGTVMAWDPVRGRSKWHVSIWPEQGPAINNGGTPDYEVYADPAVVGGDHWQKIEFDSCYGEPTFAVSKGKLPADLSLDSRTGEISGTPADSGVSEIAITLTDKKGRTDKRTLKFTVADRNTNGLTCELYCRNFVKADDYKKYRSLRDNVAYVEDFTLDLVDAPDAPFALRFLGDLKIEKSGTYKFFLTTQLAGSIVSVNGRRLVEKDFTKKTEEVSAEVELQAGE